jgi:hypothetical protein
MSLTTYDPDDVSVVALGIPITGYADGTFISIEQNEDDFSLMVGSDGDACRAKSNNRSARMTITLLQSSAANDLLSGVRALDILTPSGDGIGPFIVKDNSGRTLCAAEKAWITKPPSTTFSREVEAREWVLETDTMVWFVGGNS